VEAMQLHRQHQLLRLHLGLQRTRKLHLFMVQPHETWPVQWLGNRVRFRATAKLHPGANRNKMQQYKLHHERLPLTKAHPAFDARPDIGQRRQRLRCG
jgi:hypothetical protein